MQKNAKKRLLELHRDYTMKKHPDFPEYAIPKKDYSDKTANGLTKCITDFINYSGGQAERISNMGRFIVDKNSAKGGFYIPGTGTNGTADISATIPVTLKNGVKIGLSVKIEVKIGKDKMSEAQYKYKEKIESTGGIYIVARDFDSFLNDYDNLISSYGI